MNGTCQMKFDFEERSPVEAVLHAVAARESADPIDLPPLNDAIDADALNALLVSQERARTEVRVTFRYSGYEVSVQSSGEVSVNDDADPVIGGAD